MLRRLSVENYVLIDKLEMELDPHLNIITGETGAGKSILLGALGLLLGAKNDGSAMKDAAHNCVVEGTFDLSGRGMESFFDENDLDYAPETHDEQANAEAKLARKNFDFIVLNSLRDAGAGFRGDTNKVTFIDRSGREELPLMPKSEVAERIADKIESLLK